MKVKNIRNYQPNEAFLDSLNKEFAPLAKVATEELLRIRGMSVTVPEVEFIISPATAVLRATHFGFEASWTTPVSVSRGQDGRTITRVEIHPDAITQRALAMVDFYGEEKDYIERCINTYEDMSREKAKRLAVSKAGLGLLTELSLVNVTGGDVGDENEPLVREVERRTGELWRNRRSES